MLWIIAVLLLLVGAALTVVDALMMAMGAMLMALGESSTLMAVGALAGAIFKAVWMVCAREFFLRRMIVLALIAIVAGIFLHAFSLTAMTGLAAAGRDQTISVRGSAQEDRARAEAAYKDAKARLASMPATRLPGVIRRELKGVEADIVRFDARERAEWRAKRRRAAINKGEKARKRRNALKEELQIALEARRAEKALTAADAALRTLPAPQERDPQAAAIAKLPLAPWSTVKFFASVTVSFQKSDIARSYKRDSGKPVSASPVMSTVPSSKILNG